MKKKMFIVFLCFVKNIVFCLNDGFLEISELELWNEFDNEKYMIDLYIGTPSQFISVKIDIFSEKLNVFCIDDVSFNKGNSVFGYFPLNSTTSNLSKNHTNIKVYQDIVILKNSNISKNNTKINCIMNNSIFSKQNIGLFNPLFFSDEYPFLLICLYEKGGKIKLLNESLDSTKFNYFHIEQTTIIFENSTRLEENNFLFKTINIGMKFFDVITLFNIFNMTFSFDSSLTYHLFATPIYQKIVYEFQTNYFRKFTSFSNDRKCFAINDYTNEKKSFPSISLLLNNSELLVLDPDSYLITYPYQKIVCMNFKENFNGNHSILSFVFLKNKFIGIDSFHKRINIIDSDCKNSNLNELLINYEFIISGTKMNVVITLLISLLCLFIFFGIFFLLIYLRKVFTNTDSLSMKSYLSKKFYLNPGKIVSKKHKPLSTLDLDDLKLEIIEENSRNKKKEKKNRKEMYFEKKSPLKSKIEKNKLEKNVRHLKSKYGKSSQIKNSEKSIKTKKIVIEDEKENEQN